jgi:hypothetical protein
VSGVPVKSALEGAVKYLAAENHAIAFAPKEDLHGRVAD